MHRQVGQKVNLGVIALQSRYYGSEAKIDLLSFDHQVDIEVPEYLEMPQLILHFQA